MMLTKQQHFEPKAFVSCIECEAPTTKIYQFHGAIVDPDGKRSPVGRENLLLRDCALKNTDFVEGIVVYAGHESKAMLNHGGPRYKRTQLEQAMNLDVVWYSSITPQLFVVKIQLFIVFLSCLGVW